MNPLPDRILAVESDLAQLRITASQLADTVANLKQEVLQEEAAPLVSLPKTSPPPLPQEEAAPIELTLRAPEPEPFPVEPIPEPPLALAPAEAISPVDAKSFEMHLGRVWSVRLGIVLLTTGFIFLSRYTYDSFIRDLGPGVRLAMMYLFSFLLTGVGLFCERWKENLRSYGRIVAAGGLAAIYYCGFAAHNVEALRVIESPVLASIVLTLSAGLFCAISLWRESRVMLSTSLALAFYSISVNPIGWMACLSSAVLAAFGIAMMIRHRWVEVGFLVLAGSYLSYLWWQFAFVHIAGVSGPSSHWFVVAYWALFTAAAWVRQQAMDEDTHLIFTGINNSAFFFLFSSQGGLGQWMDYHWLFCFIFGAALITISALSKSHYPSRSRIVHLVKGIGLLTLGLALLLNGHQLFIAFLIEAVVLMAVNLKRPNFFTKIASWGVGILSCFVLSGTDRAEVHPWVWLFGAIAWIALGTMHRWIEREKTPDFIHPGGAAAAIISIGLLTIGLMGDWDRLNAILTIGTLGMIATGLLLLKAPRTWIPDTLVTFSIVGFLALIMLLTTPGASIAIILLGLTIALLSSVPPAIASKVAAKEISHGLHLYSGGFLALAMAFTWFALDASSLPKMAILTIALTIPIAGTIISRFTGLLAHLCVPFCMYATITSIEPSEQSSLFLGFLMTSAHFILSKKNKLLTNDKIIETSLFVFAALFWAGFLIQLDSPGAPMTLTATILLIAAPLFGRILTTVVAIPFYLLGLGLAFYHGSDLEIYFCISVTLALHLVRTFNGSNDKLPWMGIASLLFLWTQITMNAHPVPLAAAWAATGTLLLVTGLFLKSRCFRLIGLLILAASLGHLMIIDLIKLDPLPRILSFMTLGLGLLGLGFVYNRWQDRLKQIL